MHADTRVALWQAFSEFFLDEELEETSFRYVARVVRESGLSTSQAEALLWNEVFPALHGNLHSVAGVWGAYPREWLVANIRPAEGPARRIGPESAVREIQRCWEKALEHLSSHA